MTYFKKVGSFKDVSEDTEIVNFKVSNETTISDKFCYRRFKLFNLRCHAH